jgi:hypothetical protein
MELFKWCKLLNPFSVVSDTLAGFPRVDLAIVHMFYFSSSKLPGDVAKMGKSIEEENNVS